MLFGKKKEAKRVLIVEDDALLSEVLIKTFSKGGFNVISLKEGSRVVEIAEKKEPDIILLDLIIPGLDGFGVLKKLKANKNTKKIPVVVISNLDNVADIKSAKVLGAEEYFIKANTKLEKILKFAQYKVG